ncbi:ogr/Delta-like zinc finger family protein [Croceicoccus sp. BE223]|uniref:ogr/Delta-like zinc finger family protein n=1 Tax=Croceicoccus sp. BE223 TaxID=2817716 RepID=UPI0028673CB2|nr:ogr/Delta-like zinc finger family protein [Croceicoccus sp. BE223]MDR7101443.1 hypothetical protein [Croceicoccus sp. BE223]
MDGGHNIAEQIAAAPSVSFVHDDADRSGDLRCPHCRSTVLRRTSREITPTFRELFYICRNAACGHSFKASLSYEYGLSPSGIPDPALNLPMRPMERMPGETIPAPGALPDPNQLNLF